MWANLAEEIQEEFDSFKDAVTDPYLDYKALGWHSFLRRKKDLRKKCKQPSCTSLKAGERHHYCELHQKAETQRLRWKLKKRRQRMRRRGGTGC